MVSFIVFESNDNYRDLYVKVIKKFLYSSLDYYEIHEFKKFDNKTIENLDKINGKKIYIIDAELKGINGLELGRKIRMAGDYESPIIVTYPSEYKLKAKDIANIQILSLIEQDKDEIKSLYISISEAYKIVTRGEALTFSSFDEIRRIPYDDIYYIEKTYKDDCVTIYTKDDSCMKYITMKEFRDLLEHDTRFFYCSRSLIINLYKVSSFDCKYNTVVFDNGATTNQVSSKYKPMLKERLRSEKIK